MQGTTRFVVLPFRSGEGQYLPHYGGIAMALFPIFERYPEPT